MKSSKEVDLCSYFKLAKNVSKHSTHRIRVGAVLVKNGNPFSVGFNKLKYRRLHSRWGSVHAEMDCILTSGRDSLKGCTMYIYRETRDGLPAFARPCEDCMKIIKAYKIKKVVYTTSIFPYYLEEWL